MPINVPTVAEIEAERRGPIAKPESRKRTKARAKREQRDRTAAVREYVFTREQGICRCCRFRRAESMHEIVPRSVGGRVSRANSIAVCGDGVRGCHGMLQRHEIICGALRGERRGADGILLFVPADAKAGEWLRTERLQGVESGPTPVIRTEVA